MNDTELVARYRPHMEDIRLNEVVGKGYDLIQPKYDGWWVLIDVVNSHARILSSGAEVKQTFDIIPAMDNPGQTLIVAEWMYGTHWALDASRQGNFYCHDIVWYKGKNVSDLPYIKRWLLLKLAIEDMKYPCFRLVPTIMIDGDPSLVHKAWSDVVEKMGFEGLVFKSQYTDKVARCKKQFTMDYVVMDVVEGGGRNQGRMGALVGGLYLDDGKLHAACSVGGGFSDTMRIEFWQNRAELVGKVFEATGMQLFPSGALRHPNFNRWREDKTPQQCVR